MKNAIQSKGAPAAIGTYSQAVRAGDTVYLSGQIGLDPDSMHLADAVRMTVYLTDLAHFARVNEIMAQYVREPYPARAAVGVAGLPRGALVEIDAILDAG